jgi:hypothetical protein
MEEASALASKVGILATRLLGKVISSVTRLISVVINLNSDWLGTISMRPTCYVRSPLQLPYTGGLRQGPETHDRNTWLTNG